MGIQCESCGKITEDENSNFCKHCGFRLSGTELDVLKNIEITLKESQKRAEIISQTQTRISYASLVISVLAFLIALGALMAFVFTLPYEQRLVGIGIIIVICFYMWLVMRKFNIAPVDLEKIK